ncbi:DUF349 domain-containing protein [Geofilum rhodophaeum]|uniref:DUF349 domain-containing protein n=1 Tax=Geofilum rhodophaeum TaxID=1965019 RepID=UPI000B5287B5|nr:DUF349 domain-containing protein [Geofilum rhodophaeum]
MEANELNKESQEETRLNATEQVDESKKEEQKTPEAAPEKEAEPTAKHAEAETNAPSEKQASDEQAANKVEAAEEVETTAPTQEDYSNLDRESLVAKFRQLLKEQPISDLKPAVDTLRKVFDKASEEIENKAKAAFVASGEPEELFVHQPDNLQKEFSALLFEYRSKRDSERQSQEHEKEKNLAAKYEVIEGIKDLLNRQESLNETFQEFRDLQQRWRDIGPVPQGKLHDLWETFHLHVENFYNYIKINNELRDLDIKKNYEEKIALCEKAEELLLEDSAVKAFKALQKLHDQWREVGPVPREKKEELWERFKAATSKINQRQQEHFEALKNQLKKNLEAKIELCEKAEALLAEELHSPKEWEEKSKQLIDLQQVWKTIGFAPKKDNNLVYERFRKACDSFFNSKREFFKTYKDEQQNNLQLKTELCIQAEAMKESNDWKKTTDEYIRIQKKWKEIGPVPRKQSDIVWKRFREACDYFFNRKKDFFSHIDEEQDKNLEAKEALIAELTGFEIKEDNEKNFEILQDFQRRWSNIGFVPLKEKERINQEFRNLINQKFDHLNLDEVNKNLQKFRNKLENWKAEDQFAEKIGQERNRIMLKLKQLENDLVVWENNIGFFAKSKNSDALVRDFQHKIENGKRNMELLNKKLDLIDEML